MDTYSPLSVRRRASTRAVRSFLRGCSHVASAEPTVTRPEPHPLDFDWRFTSATAESLARRVGRARCLAVGAPSVAERLQVSSEVVLVDRHPIQLCDHVLAADPGQDEPSRQGCSVAVVDPPWYPETYSRWLAWTARSMDIGSTIFAALWPVTTRPSAPEERDRILEWTTGWARAEIENDVLEYETPRFESAAISASLSGPRAPRKGDLLKLRVQRLPALPKALAYHETWTRFVINDYQIGVRLGRISESTPSILRVPGAHEWIWPSVSRRAPGRDFIDVWSSRNEVARITSSSRIVSAIRSYFSESAASSIEYPSSPSILGPLQEWLAPLPPVKRFLEWNHQS